jgi:phage virion morphogenesis protein
MIRIRLDDGEVTAAFGRAAAALGDLTPLMTEVGEYLVDATQRRLRAGTAPDGSAWAPRSSATLAAYARRRIRPRGGPLWTSGVLEQTIARQAGPASVEVGSDRIYAALMQFGGTKAAFPHLWGDIPARPFLGLSAGDREAILEMAADFLAGAARPGP